MEVLSRFIATANPAPTATQVPTTITSNIRGYSLSNITIMLEQ